MNNRGAGATEAAPSVELAEIVTRLTRDFPTAPARTVRALIEEATRAVAFFGDELRTAPELIERIARNELSLLTDVLDDPRRQP